VAAVVVLVESKRRAQAHGAVVVVYRVSRSGAVPTHVVHGNKPPTWLPTARVLLCMHMHIESKQPCSLVPLVRDQGMPAAHHAIRLHYRPYAAGDQHQGPV
jgi:hypothetical protein